jgi:hypothetical protein
MKIFWKRVKKNLTKRPPCFILVTKSEYDMRNALIHINPSLKAVPTKNSGSVVPVNILSLDIVILGITLIISLLSIIIIVG